MRKCKYEGLVYSTDSGRLCPGCGNSPNTCSCKHGGSNVASDGVVRIGRQTKGRKGSGVTVISGIPLGGVELKKLAKKLKQKCGSGGTVKDGIIEIQGDHREALLQVLKSTGYNVKLSGS